MVAVINDMEIEYTEETPFRVQVGRGDKGAYRTRFLFCGRPGQAVAYYNAINIGNGYKKRLKVESKVIARQFS